MRVESRALRLLAGEAVRDASRRRIVPAVLAISFLSLMMMDSCTSCSVNLGVGDQPVPVDVLSWTGMLTFAVLGLWSIALAGLLASDHLRAVFDDGSATLLLARPISRPTLALARLLGSLAVSLGAALVLCLGATFLLAVRGGLPLGPAIGATLAVVMSSVAVAALAMTASLFVPRIVTMLFVFGGVGLIGVLNVASAAGRSLSGFYFVLDSFGPPLLSTLILALSPWSQQVPETISAWDVLPRTLAWAAGGVALLLVVFDQRELANLEDG